MNAVPRIERGDDEGKLAANIMHFARVLRAAGLPVGPRHVLRGLQAVQVVGISNRDDFYWALHAVFVNRRDQRDIFDQAFHVFWRNPRILEQMLSLVLPPSPVQGGETDKKDEISRRLAEALRSGRSESPEAHPDADTDVEIDTVMTWSNQEVLQKMDFEKMSTAEVAAAKRAIAEMRLPIMKVPTRRFRPVVDGVRVDMRATLRAALRSGGGTIPLRFRRRQERHPPLVILCDISGSMSRYSRMLLHFMHAITNDRDRVFSFVFGTRLTNITRLLRYRDVDEALAKIGEAVDDWSGGTRIGRCLRDFNRDWSRRVLGQGAVVLMITDGLDRDAGAGLAFNMDRLHKSCRRLIWLNPLLRYEGYEPKSRGAQAMVDHVDHMQTIHNLESLTQLADGLSRLSQVREGPEWRRFELAA